MFKLQYHNMPPHRIIEELEDELYLAYKTILELMPLHLQELLDTYGSLNSLEESMLWERSIINKVVDLAVPLETPHKVTSFSDRAYCPLCGESAHNIYPEEGFTIPDGLKRHLKGTHNSVQCPIIRAVLGLAKFSIRHNMERQVKIKKEQT